MSLYNLRNWPVSSFIEFLYKQRKRIYDSNKKNLILIAAYPRSACNYLSFLLSGVLDYRSDKLTFGTGFSHDSIYYPKLFDSLTRKNIVTQHIRYNSILRPIVNELQLTPIVLVRNIFDVVISYNDYISKSGWGPLDPDKYKISPEFCADFMDFDEERKYDFIIDMVIPWYISFYVSWYHYSKTLKDVDVFWLTYESFTDNQKKTIIDICDFLGLYISQEKLDKLIAKNVKVNYNKGVSGRGSKLTSSQKSRIKSYTKYFSDIDFSDIGL